MRSGQQSYRNLHTFRIFQVKWGKLPIWPWVTVVKKNEYMPISAHGYLSSNK